MVPVKEDVIRCLKRFLAREVFQAVMTDHLRNPGCFGASVP